MEAYLCPVRCNVYINMAVPPSALEILPHEEKAASIIIRLVAVYSL